MYRRRFLAAALAGAALPLTPSLAGAESVGDVLRAEFEARDYVPRRIIQLELQLMQLYPAEVDGAYGPMTEAALIAAAEAINAATDGEYSFDLSTRAEAREFMDLLHMEMFMFMYDDGFEG